MEDAQASLDGVKYGKDCASFYTVQRDTGQVALAPGQEHYRPTRLDGVQVIRSIA